MSGDTLLPDEDGFLKPYGSLIKSLVLLDREKENSCPNFEKIRYLDVKTQADKQELENTLNRLKYINTDEGERFLNTSLKKIKDIGLNNAHSLERETLRDLENNKGSHPLIRRRSAIETIKQSHKAQMIEFDAEIEKVMRPFTERQERAEFYEYLLKSNVIAQQKLIVVSDMN